MSAQPSAQESLPFGSFASDAAAPTGTDAEPSDWPIERVRDVGEVQLGRQRSPAQETGRYQVPYLRVANVYDGWIDYSDVLQMNFTPAEQQTFGLRDGDILLNEGQSLELVGRSAIYRGPADTYCFQNTLVRFRASGRVVPEYCQAVFQRWLATGAFQTIAKQTTSIAHLGAGRFANMVLPVPPLPEQKAIAHVLTSLDALIADTEAAIAKLEAVRAALLHDLLTRGVDENGEVRIQPVNGDRVHALGWSFATLGSYLSMIEGGKSPDAEAVPAGRGEWGVLKVSAVHPSGFRPNENKRLSDPRHVNPAYEVHDGDLLITRANTPELVGQACLVQSPPERLLLCDKTLRLRVHETDDARFVFYLLQYSATRAQIEVAATGSSGSMKNISQTAIRALRVVRPPFAEQARIADVLWRLDEQLARERSTVGKIGLVRTSVADALLSGRTRLHVSEVGPV
jgi:type I restriction enzyme S subunit